MGTGGGMLRASLPGGRLGAGGMVGHAPSWGTEGRLDFGG